MIKFTRLLVTLGVFVTNGAGQWPLGPAFYRSMDQMTTNLNNMAARLERMGDRLAREQSSRQINGISISGTPGGMFVSSGGTLFVGGAGGFSRVDEDKRRAQDGVPFGNEGRVFITASGGLGYAYNSSDGSFTLYSLGNNSPPHGYMYHVGPHRTSFQNW